MQLLGILRALLAYQFSSTFSEVGDAAMDGMDLLVKRP
jgi:hypothetical protein